MLKSFYNDTNTFSRYTYLLGFAGAGAILLGMILSGIAYRGRADEAYNLLNHFVSELGEVGIAPWAMVFNIGLLIGGVCIIGFMLGVARLMKHWFGLIFAVSGVITGVSGTLVGLYPMNNLEPHIKVALSFFNWGMVCIGLFAFFVIAFPNKSDFPRWFVVPGLVTFGAFFTFLYLVPPIAEEGENFFDGIMRYLNNRPPFSATAIVEWFVVFAVLGWILLVSFYLRRREDKVRDVDSDAFEG